MTNQQHEFRLKASRVGWLLLVAVAVVVVALEPALSWFVIPAIMLGVVVAILLHSSIHASSSSIEGQRRKYRSRRYR